MSDMTEQELMDQIAELENELDYANDEVMSLENALKELNRELEKLRND